MRTLFVAPVATVNLKALGLMSRDHVYRDTRTVAGLRRTIIGWQEAGWIDRYVRSIWRLMPPNAPEHPGPDWQHSFIPGESCGISVDTNEWQPIDSADRLLLHPGKRGVCEDRYYLAQDLRHRDSGTLVRVIVAHYAPKRGGLGKSLQKIGNASLIREIGRTLDRGVPAIVLADFNQRGKPLGGNVDGRLVKQSSGKKGRGIDKIVCVAPAGHQFVLPSQGYDVVPLHSDHDAVCQTVHYLREA